MNDYTPTKTGAKERPLVRALRESGYTVAEGVTDVRNLIHAVSGDDEQPRCSGYRVFPDGTKCAGCGDCNPEVETTKASFLK